MCTLTSLSCVDKNVPETALVHAGVQQGMAIYYLSVYLDIHFCVCVVELRTLSHNLLRDEEVENPFVPWMREGRGTESSITLATRLTAKLWISA